MRLRVGFIGSGGRGQAIWDRLRAFADVEVRGGWLARSAPEAEVPNGKGLPRLDSAEALLLQVDALVIAVPVEERFVFAQLALRQQLPCWVEAPIACTPEQMRRSVALVEEARVSLKPGHTLLFHPVVWALRERWQAPQLLEVRQEVALHPRRAPVDVASELLYPNLALLLGLVSSPVHRLEATAVCVSGLAPEPDGFRVHLRFENGLEAQLWVSRLSPEAAHELRLYQTGQVARADLIRNTLEWTRLHPRAEPGGLNLLYERPRLSEADALSASLGAFLEAVRRNQDPPVSVYDAALVYQVFRNTLEKSRVHGAP